MRILKRNFLVYKGLPCWSIINSLFLFKKWVFFFVFVSWGLCAHEYRCLWGQDTSDLLEFGVQAVVPYLMCLLGMELGSSLRTECFLNHRAISPVCEHYVHPTCSKVRAISSLLLSFLSFLSSFFFKKKCFFYILRLSYN